MLGSAHGGMLEQGMGQGEGGAHGKFEVCEKAEAQK